MAVSRTETGRFSSRALKAAPAALELTAKRRPGRRILIYHWVGTNLGREMEVATATFACQIDYLEAEGSIVPLFDAVYRISTPGDDRVFVVTFDEGYAGIYTNVFPLLLDPSVPFQLYVTMLPVEDPSADWAPCP